MQWYRPRPGSDVHLFRRDARGGSQLKVSSYSSSDDAEGEGACEGEVNVHEARKVL